MWGSAEALNRERIRKAEEVKRYQKCNASTINYLFNHPSLINSFLSVADIFEVKQTLKDFRKDKQEWSPQGGLMQESGKVVLTAIGM